MSTRIESKQTSWIAKSLGTALFAVATLGLAASAEASPGQHRGQGKYGKARPGPTKRVVVGHRPGVKPYAVKKANGRWIVARRVVRKAPARRYQFRPARLHPNPYVQPARYKKGGFYHGKQQPKKWGSKKDQHHEQSGKRQKGRSWR